MCFKHMIFDTNNDIRNFICIIIKIVNNRKYVKYMYKYS